MSIMFTTFTNRTPHVMRMLAANVAAKCISATLPSSSYPHWYGISRRCPRSCVSRTMLGEGIKLSRCSHSLVASDRISLVRRIYFSQAEMSGNWSLFGDIVPTKSVLMNFCANISDKIHRNNKEIELQNIFPKSHMTGRDVFIGTTFVQRNNLHKQMTACFCGLLNISGRHKCCRWFIF